MYIKLLGENERGFPTDCTVGRVYEVVGKNGYDLCFIDDVGEEDFAYAHDDVYSLGQWQVVDKNGGGCMSLYKTIKELQSASGSNAKTAILQANKDSGLLKDYLKSVYDPSLSYYQTKIDKSKGWNLDWMDYIEVDGVWVCNFNYILENVRALADREVTGDKAKEYLSGLYSCISPESKELLELLIKRSAGAGVGDTMILKVFPDSWFPVPYQRCSLMDDKSKAKFAKLPEFLVQEKLDGSFCYLVKEAGKPVEAITRAGSKYPKEFAEKLSAGLPDGFVVVGELLVYDGYSLKPLDRKTGNGILNSVLKGGDIDSNLNFQMTAWDCISVGDF